MPDCKPNIIILTCHDLGRHLGCYGVPTVRSPNIDGLAAEGVRFENSFCTAPQCSPSRASIFTGRYPHSNGVMGLTHGNFAWDLNPGEKHLAQLLSEAGWRTAVCGVHHESRDAGKAGYQDVLNPGGFDASLREEKAVEFIRQQSSAGSPFFLHVGFVEPHRLPGPGGFGPTALDSSLGVTVPPYLADEPEAREDFAAFQGAVRHVDGAIGRILEALDGHGLRENTLVVMTTDHGIPFPRAKCSLYDPGLETCLILRWLQAGWENGRVYPEMVSNVDYVPTLLEMLELPVPEAVQGRSFAPLLSGENYRPRTEVFGEMTYHD
jgi:N-sulfoglucosamine sulfohydrolase